MVDDKSLVVERLRLEVLRSWTIARYREAEAGWQEKGLERWWRAEQRARNEVIGMERPYLEPTTWVPFAALLDAFEDAVRNDERARGAIRD